MSNEKLKKVIHKRKSQDNYKAMIENGKISFERPVGSAIISFSDEKIEIKWLKESEWHKDNLNPPLVSLSNNERLTVEDFKENSKKAKVSYRNRAYQI